MKKLSLIFLALVLGSCVGTSQPARFYALQTEDVGNISYGQKISVGVDEFTIPTYLDKPQIIIRDANGVELSPSEMNRWSEPLGVMLSRVLADDLSRLFPNALIKPRGYDRDSFDYVVSVEVNRFEGTWNKNAVLDVWWNLSNKNGNIVYRQRNDLHQTLGKGYDNLAEVQSRLVAQLAAEIASVINKRP